MMRRVTQCGTFPLKSQGGGALLSGFQKVKVLPSSATAKRSCGE
jgi:hypothetical protein